MFSSNMKRIANTAHGPEIAQQQHHAHHATPQHPTTGVTKVNKAFPS